MSKKPTEAEFLAEYEPIYPVQRVAKDLYRQLYPSGMHTNGPCRVLVDASHLTYLLTKWRAQP